MENKKQSFNDLFLNQEMEIEEEQDIQTLDEIKRKKEILESLSLENIKSEIDDETLDSLSKMGKNLGIDMNDILEKSINGIKNIVENTDMNTLANIMNTFGDSFPINIAGSEEDIQKFYNEISNLANSIYGQQTDLNKSEIPELFNSDYLTDPGSFGVIEYSVSKDSIIKKLKERLLEKGIEKLENLSQLEDLVVYSNLNAPLHLVSQLEEVLETEKYALYKVNPLDTTKFGFYIAIIINKYDDFEIVIPSYGNTFDPNKNNTEQLYNLSDKRLFSEDGKLLYENNILELIQIGLENILVPYGTPFISINDFGDVSLEACKQKDGRLCKIGEISSNDTTKARLCKKDMDLEDRTIFELYLAFTKEFPKENLEILSQIIAEIPLDEFKELPLSNCIELKASSSLGAVYIECPQFEKFITNINDLLSRN